MTRQGQEIQIPVHRPHYSILRYILVLNPLPQFVDDLFNRVTRLLAFSKTRVVVVDPKSLRKMVRTAMNNKFIVILIACMHIISRNI